MLMMTSPWLRYFWFHSIYSLTASCSLRSAVCSLQSAVCSLRSAVCKCHTPRNAILPARDDNYKLIKKYFCRSFCKVSTSSTLTNIPTLLLKTLKKFIVKPLIYLTAHDTVTVCNIFPPLCLKGILLVQRLGAEHLWICTWKQAQPAFHIVLKGWWGAKQENLRVSSCLEWPPAFARLCWLHPIQTCRIY